MVDMSKVIKDFALSYGEVYIALSDVYTGKPKNIAIHCTADGRVLLEDSKKRCLGEVYSKSSTSLMWNIVRTGLVRSIDDTDCDIHFSDDELDSMTDSIVMNEGTWTSFDRTMREVLFSAIHGKVSKAE